MPNSFNENFSTNIIGGPGNQGIHDASTTQKHDIGERLRLADGRVFYYGHAVSALAVGKLCAQDFSVTGTVSIDGKGAAGAAGATQLVLTDTATFSTADAANVYSGGYLHVTDDAGEGFTYRIKANAQGTGAGVMTLDLIDPIVTATTTSTSFSITGNQFRNLAIYDNATDDLVAGIAPRAVAAGSYGWIQTWGWATVLADENAGTIAAGTIAQCSDGVNGAAQPFGGGAINSEDDHSYHPEPIIGYFGTAAADTEYVPIFLQLMA